MKKALKVLGIFFVCVLTLFGSASTVFADDQNMGLCEQPTYFEYDEIEMFGVNKPYNSEWDLSKEGKYTFSGWCIDNYLYTNYTFTGASSVRIWVNNNSNQKITVKLLKQQSGVDWSQSTRNIEAGKSLSWRVDSLSKSSYYYLQFSKGSNVSGYIEAV